MPDTKDNGGKHGAKNGKTDNTLPHQNTEKQIVRRRLSSESRLDAGLEPPDPDPEQWIIEKHLQAFSPD